jgi:hypothetical protein
MALYRPEWTGLGQINSFIVAALRPLPEPQQILLDYVPLQHTTMLDNMLARPLTLDLGLLRDGEIVTDARNRALLDMAESQIAYRHAVVRSLPAAFLVN